jgi:predicted short-subunit dehydrogenase-like oxidoreductase (DUF2520 family)
VRIAFIGAGRVAQTLSRAFTATGLDVVVAASRDRSASRTAAGQAELVFLTVRDDVIRSTCESLPWRRGQRVVHCSGGTELEALNHARHAGAAVGAFHPLQMFASPDAALRTLAGITITITGEPPLAAELSELARRIGGVPMPLAPGNRALYHASAYYVGPFLIALMREAARMWASFGIDEGRALAALVPLLNGTVAAVLADGLAGGMGGCVARGDIGMVARHLEALQTFSPEAEGFYRTLARRTIPMGIERGTLTPAHAARIEALLTAPFHDGGVQSG